ncbi:uncharacterized protein [Antedon mediterranea]|uniref:uncharacterized protein n=1 Tax=Antedon mediterranea TaxID=105859 RepID=UPI003AF47175
MSSLSSSASSEDEHDIVAVNWRGVFENDPRVPAGVVEENVEKILDKNKENEHNGCITTHPWFQAAILNPATLQIAYASQYDELVVEGRIERKYRYTAYRQFVRWCWRYLGRHRRVPITSCVINKISEAFPDPEQNYTAFTYPRLDED